MAMYTAFCVELMSMMMSWNRLVEMKLIKQHGLLDVENENILNGDLVISRQLCLQ